MADSESQKSVSKHNEWKFIYIQVLNTAATIDSKILL